MKNTEKESRFRWKLTAQLMFIMLFLVAGTIGLGWLINSLFLENYYAKNKQRDLLSGYGEIKKAWEEGTLEAETFDIPFETMCANGNMNIVVFQLDLFFQEMQVIRSSYNDMEILQERMAKMLYGDEPTTYYLIQETDQYQLARETDTRMQAEYLVLLGTLEDEVMIYMRTPLESVKESANLTNRFYLTVGGFSLIICAVIIFFLALQIARPIRKLTELSMRMTHLDFEAKYVPQKNRVREIHELGMHMNTMSDTLEQTISELKVANNELQDDIAKKEQIDEMRKDFLSNVTHELKTPLALIGGYAEGLKEGIHEDEESKDYYCEVIMDETEKMNRIVQQLLALNQLEFGKEALEIVRFDLTELVLSVIKANELLLEQEQIHCEFTQEEAVFVWGDIFKIEQVISNYMSNAIHYAKNEKRIQIRLTRMEGKIRLSVYNSGDGIAPEEQEKIWDKFYKVDKARTREYGGSGIGLSIVKAIMDSHHQACGVENREDGVEFWMELECDAR